MKKVLLTICTLLFATGIAYSADTYAGFTLGTPGVVNFNIGFYSEYTGCQFSGSVLHMLYLLGDDTGEETVEEIEEETGLFLALLQGNFDIVFTGSATSPLFAFSVAGGMICFSDGATPENDITIFYAGPCFHLLIEGFFLELGAAYGRDFSAKYQEDSTHIIPLIQLGYMTHIE